MIPLQADSVGFVQFLPIILILVVFWFLIIRPQQREQKERRAMQDALKKGDRVVTSGGVHGVVVGAEEQIITLEVAALQGGERVRIKFDRLRIERRLPTVEKAGD